ncbi:MAG: ATP synthase F0 subunit B [Deltaproteobacteria bacterium]|nr:ATP synthase F0 subunit B [Deltaproteobacteria bacterium]
MVTQAVLLAAVSQDPPLIDIDYTLLVQAGIFLVLFVVMRKLVFLPYLQARRERDANIGGARNEAKSLDIDCTERTQRYEERLMAARKEAATGRAQRRAEGTSKGEELLTDARQRADAKLQAARVRIAKSVPAAELALRTRADQLAQAIASKVLGRSV